MNKDRPVRRRIRRKEGRQDQTRWIAAEFFLNIGGSEPIGIHSESATYEPVSFSVHIPCHAYAWSVRLRRLIHCMTGGNSNTVGHPILEGRTTPKVEVPENGSIRPGIWISLIVEAETQR